MFGTPLVVVMGHSMCGAVLATLEEHERATTHRSPNLRSIVDRIWPSLETFLETELRHDRPALVEAAIRANIRASVDHLRHGSQVLEGMIQNGELLIVGAEYSLETGIVEFLEARPPHA
jgi:carbonic anhydrase